MKAPPPPPVINRVKGLGWSAKAGKISYYFLCTVWATTKGNKYELIEKGSQDKIYWKHKQPHVCLNWARVTAGLLNHNIYW